MINYATVRIDYINITVSENLAFLRELCCCTAKGRGNKNNGHIVVDIHMQVVRNL